VDQLLWKRWWQDRHNWESVGFCVLPNINGDGRYLNLETFQLCRFSYLQNTFIILYRIILQRQTNSIFSSHCTMTSDHSTKDKIQNQGGKNMPRKSRQPRYKTLPPCDMLVMLLTFSLQHIHIWSSHRYIQSPATNKQQHQLFHLEIPDAYAREQQLFKRPSRCHSKLGCTSWHNLACITDVVKQCTTRRSS